MRDVAAVGLIPRLVLPDVGEALDEFFDVALVEGDARQPRRRVPGVIEGDKHLNVLFFAGADPRRRPGQRVAVGDRVVGRDVAGDLRVQLLPQLVAKHLRVLVADTHLVAGGGVRRGPGRGACVGGGLMAGCAGREQRAGTQQQRDREGDEGSR